MPSNILHIETSSLACSVAISRAGDVLSGKTLHERNVHSSMLVPLIEESMEVAGLQMSDLSAVSVSIGPGSYTGLRVGLSTAKGICYAAGIPLITIDTLESLAGRARTDLPGYDLYLALLDARRMDAYMAVFGSDGRREGENRFVTLSRELIDEIKAGAERMVICGEGLERIRELDLSGVELLRIQCDAQNLVRLATKAFDNQLFADLPGSVPGYLKAPNITTPA